MKKPIPIRAQVGTPQRLREILALVKPYTEDHPVPDAEPELNQDWQTHTGSRAVN